MMKDRRVPLSEGTIVELNENQYRITGKPLGFGGSSILYPAERMVWKGGQLESFGKDYALKECYPLSYLHEFIRDPETGQIVPAHPGEESSRWLENVQEQVIREGEIVRQIYKTAGRVLPVYNFDRQVKITLPQKEKQTVANMMTVTDALNTKGQSLQSMLRFRGRLSALESFRILQQLLFALREVHKAGFLHLDINEQNLFIHGSLKDGDALVYLVDFGSARAMTGGKTETITERVLFASEGFTAPEMLLENDGTLQLGPEADLFSACSLLIYLLTGRKQDVRRLLAKQNDVYLTPLQALWLGCPLFLVDRIQRFLTKGLAADPRERYGSAEMMLEEVSDILIQLQPGLPKKKSVKYDAFICYQHNPKDRAAAKALQERLERFRIPMGNRTLPSRPFRRVFLDEGELVSGDDLSEKIKSALTNSAWLIVVCSGKTPKSQWVKKEIDEFIETHAGSKSQILAILTDGTPETSFPDALKGTANGKYEIYAPHAMGDTPEEIRRQIRREVYLKIAAPMLNRESYDDLRQRYLTWQLKRTAAAASAIILALTGFTAYAVNRASVISRQAVRIEQEYENALYNESLFLTEQAQNCLDRNDPMGAMEILLQALPSQMQNRPVLPEAEYLLGEALGIYRTPSLAEGTVSVERLIPAGNSRFFLDDTGKYLFTWDRFGESFQIWDTGTVSLVHEIPAEAMAEKLMFLEEYLLLEQHETPDSFIFDTSREYLLPREQALLIRLDNRIVSLNYVAGTENWSVKRDNIIDFALAEDQTCLVVLSRYDPYVLEDAKIKPPDIITVEILSAQTGEQLHRSFFELADGQSIDKGLCVSADRRWAAIPVVQNDSLYTFTDRSHSIWILDLETGAFRQLQDDAGQLEAMKFKDGCLSAIMVSDTAITWANGNHVERTAPLARVSLALYDPASGTQRFSAKREVYAWEDSDVGISFVSYETGTEAGNGILFHWNDCCLLMDLKNGVVLREYRLPSAIAALHCTENGFEAVSRDGSVTNGTYDSEELSSMSVYPSPVSAACWKGNTCYIQNSPDFAPDWTIRTYLREQWDKQYTQAFALEESGWQVYSSFEMDGGTAVLLFRENRVCLVNIDTGEHRFWDIPADIAFSHIGIQGLSGDRDILYWSITPEEMTDSWLNKNYYGLNLHSGEIFSYDIPSVPEMDVHFFQNPVYGEDGFYVITMQFPESGQNQLTLWYWDLIKGTMEVLHQQLLPDPLEGCHMEALNCSRDGKRIWFAAGRSTDTRPSWLFLLNRETGKLIQTPVESLPETGRDNVLFWMTGSSAWMEGCYQWNTDGTLAIMGYGETVYVLEADGTVRHRIDTGEQIVKSLLTLREESLILISESGKISRWRLSDGECMGEIFLSDYDHQEGTIDALMSNTRFLDEETLAVYTDFNGFLLNLSRDGLAVERKIGHGFDYDPEGNRFLAAEPYLSGRDMVIGTFPVYSLETLIAMAEDRLGR